MRLLLIVTYTYSNYFNITFWAIYTLGKLFLSQFEWLICYRRQAARMVNINWNVWVYYVFYDIVRCSLVTIESFPQKWSLIWIPITNGDQVRYVCPDYIILLDLAGFELTTPRLWSEHFTTVPSRRHKWRWFNKAHFARSFHNVTSVISFIDT